MTVTEPAPIVCPACRSENTNVGASGLALCFDCAHQWDPKEVTALPAPLLAPFGMAPVEAVYGPTDADVANHPANVPTPEPQGAPRITDHMTDAEIAWAVRHADALDALDATPADPDAHTFPPTWEGLAAYRAAGGVIDNELWYDNFIAPAAEPLHPADAQGNEEAAAIQMTAELATLIVKAAVASMPGVLSAEETDVAPIGFLPDDPGLFPIVEQAAIQAVRGVIAVFELDAAALLEAIGTTGGDDGKADD